MIEWGRSHGEGHGNPLQYPCLEKPMDRGAWRATVHRVAKLDTAEQHTHSVVGSREQGKVGGTVPRGQATGASTGPALRLRSLPGSSSHYRSGPPWEGGKLEAFPPWTKTAGFSLIQGGSCSLFLEADPAEAMVALSSEHSAYLLAGTFLNF